MKLKTSELIGPALDWAVAKCGPTAPIIAPILSCGKQVGVFVHLGERDTEFGGYIDFEPSENWAQGGPIIERERLTLEPFTDIVHGDAWAANAVWIGPTPLIAAMRCFVASKLGDEVEVPDELIGDKHE